MILLKTERGFTLIELLIVIVIIGILAGVLIAIIDPAAQQNRARDANVQATINKIALAAEAFNSAYGRIPLGFELIDALGGTACVGGQSGANCKVGTATAFCRSSPADTTCHIVVAGNALPLGGTDGCTNGYSGNGAGQCYYRYEPGASAGTFQLYAKSFGLPDTVFGYWSAEGEIRECDSTAVPSNCL